MIIENIRNFNIVRIENITKGTTLANQAKVATKFWDRTKGLLGKDYLPQDTGLLIIPCSAIHTFFMRFPIDVIFVNKRGLIVALRKSMKKFRYFSSNFQGYFVVELPINTLEITSTTIGDKIGVEALR